MSSVLKVKQDMKTAMKNKDKEKLSALRMLLSELEKEKVTKKLQKVEELTDDQFLDVVSRSVKKLNKEIQTYKDLNKDTQKQELEKSILMSYMPKQLSEDEIREVLIEVIRLSQNSKTTNPMKYAAQKLKGKADMSLVSKILKELIY